MVGIGIAIVRIGQAIEGSAAVGRDVVSLMLGWKGLPYALAAPRLFAVAREVPASNKAPATAIRDDLVMIVIVHTQLKPLVFALNQIVPLFSW